LSQQVDLNDREITRRLQVQVRSPLQSSTAKSLTGSAGRGFAVNTGKEQNPSMSEAADKPDHEKKEYVFCAHLISSFARCFYY
jgi:hypothetical protein